MATPEYQLVRFKVDRNHFEVAVKPATLSLYRQKKLSMDETLYHNEIYRDFNKGDVVSNDELFIAFETSDKKKVLEKILLDGEYQLSTKERREMTEKKFKKKILKTLKYKQKHLPFLRTLLLTRMR